MDSNRATMSAVTKTPCQTIPWKIEQQREVLRCSSRRRTRKRVGKRIHSQIAVVFVLSVAFASVFKFDFTSASHQPTRKHKTLYYPVPKQHIYMFYKRICFFGLWSQKGNLYVRMSRGCPDAIRTRTQMREITMIA